MKYSLFSAFLLLVSNVAFAQLQLSFSSVSPTCDGFTNGTATALPSGGTAPYAYSWSNGQGGQTTLGIGAGTYSVTVTDAANLSTTGEVTVTAPAPLVVSITPEGLGCTDVEGTLVAGSVGGTAPYTYAWENGSSGESLPVTQSGLYYVTATDANGCSALANYFVRPPAEIVIQFLTLDAPSCANSSDGSIVVNIFGNNAPYTWVWENGVTNQSLTNIPGGAYSITATDALGCTKVQTATLNAPPALVVEVFPTNIPCASLPNGGAVNAGVAGGVNPYTFLWNTGSAASGLQGIPAGDYSVTVTDVNGCTATDAATVTQPTPLVASVVSITPACGGNNGSATISAEGGTPPYKHVWSNGQMGPTATNLAPGQYYVCTFDANNCQMDLWIIIPVGEGLDVTLNLVKAECAGVDNGVATAIVNPPTGTYTYAWNIQNSPNISQLNGIPANTVVSVTVTDVNTGCQGTATGVLGTHNQVQVAVTDTDATCGGAPTGSASAIASLGTAPYSYVWTYPNATQVPGSDISNLVPGDYFVTATDAKGCTALGVAQIGADDNLTAAFQLDILDCTSDNVLAQFTNVSTPGFTSFNWTITYGSSIVTTSFLENPTINFGSGASGTVQLIVTGAGGCSDTITAPFTAVGAPVYGVSVQNDYNENCEYLPAIITVSASQEYTYTWSPMTDLTFNPDPQHVIANPSQTTVYQLIVNGGACSDTIPVTVLHLEPPVITVAANSIVSCDSVVLLTATATGSSTLIWYNAANVQIGTGDSITVTAGATAVYTVVATSPQGCTNSESISVTGNSVNVDAAISQPLSACENTPVSVQVVNLDPNDNLTYEWSSSSPALSISPQGAAQVTLSGPAGSYTVTVVVTNQFDCQSTYTTQVTMTPGESLEGAISADLCNGLLVGFENTGTVSGTWNFGDNSAPSTENDPTHTYAQAGTYTVTFVSPQACVAPYSAQIEVLASQAVQAAIGNNLQNCVDSATVQFTDQTVGTGLTSWQWTFSNGTTSNEQNPSVVFGQAGAITATLVVTDANGCSDSATAQPQIDIINEFVSEAFDFCAPSSVALNPEFNQNYTYSWFASPADPNLQANNPNPSVSPASPTTYSVSITNGLCSVLYAALVTPREPASLQLPADQVVCTSDPVSLTAQSANATSIKWSLSPTMSPVLTTGNTVVVVPMPNGMYYVEATNGAGCQALDSVGVNNASVNIVAESLNRDICKGFATELTVTNMIPVQNLTYEWTQGLQPIPNPMVIPLADATYEVKVSNQFGCKDTLTFQVNVTEVAVTAEVTGPDTICTGQTTTLLATASGNASVYTYQWAPATTLSDNDVPDPTAEPTETTDYIVTVLGDGLCPASASVTVYYMSTECAEPYIFVPKAFTPNGDENNDKFIVRGTNIKEMRFIVWDRWGEKVFETTDILSTGWDGTYNGKESTPDSYAWYLEVTCGNGATYINKGNVTLLK
ncbi:MAG: gliding motility-associated C-terminal domain-containing protein [Saprospiraceae bacterium]|nr:gliding motility-associated C-terminal domain-containing protein [Saprospiraceae bacterium]